MSRFLLLFLCLLGMHTYAFSQSLVDQDAVLKELRTQLPAGWIEEATDKNLVFFRKDSIWIRYVNHINEQANPKKTNADERNAVIRKEGKHTRALISYRMEPRWPAPSIKKAEDQNRKTFAQIAKLPEKYKIESLYDTLWSSKGEEHYSPKTDADKLSIKKFGEERDKLLKTVILVPFLQTEKYSLFPDGSSGMEDGMSDVYPEQATTEIYKVQNMVSDVCRINRGE